MIIQIEIDTRAPLGVILSHVLEEIGAADRTSTTSNPVRVLSRKGASRRQIPDLTETIERVFRDPRIPPDQAKAIIEGAKAAHAESAVRSERARMVHARRKASSQPQHAAPPSR